MNGRTMDSIWENIKKEGSAVKKEIEIAESLAEVINELSKERVKSKVSQRELAEKSGIKQANIARIEKLQIIPRLDTLIRLAKALNLEICVWERNALQKEVLTETAVYNNFEHSISNRYYSPSAINQLVYVQ